MLNNKQYLLNIPCESRLPKLFKVGAFSEGCSGISPDWLLMLPWRPIDPTPGVVRSGIGGGPPPTGAGLVPIGTGGISSVGLPPRDEIDVREVAFVIIDGRHTFYKKKIHS